MVVDGEPVVVPNAHGDLTTPSVVAYLPDGQILVGKEAMQCVPHAHPALVAH